MDATGSIVAAVATDGAATAIVVDGVAAVHATHSHYLGVTKAAGIMVVDVAAKKRLRAKDKKEAELNRELKRMEKLPKPQWLKDYLAMPDWHSDTLIEELKFVAKEMKSLRSEAEKPTRD